MFSRLHLSRFVAALVVAFLVVAGLQGAASAATKRGVTTAASPAVGVVGTVFTMSGKVTRSPRGSTVQIQRKSGSKWIKVASTRTVNTTGSYAVRITRSKSLSTTLYRAYAPKTKKLQASASRAVAVAALRRALSSLSATPTTTTAGTTVVLTGSVFPFVKNTVVTIQRKVGTSWVGLTNAVVNANGTFARSVVPSTSTTYRASVPRAGSNAPVVSNERAVVAKPLILNASLLKGNRLSAYNPSKIPLSTFGNQVGIWSAKPLPPGIVFNNATGVLSGTPTTVGDTNIVINFRQTSTGLNASSKTLTLRVDEATKPVIETATLPAATNGTGGYSATLSAVGNPTGTWSASGLPTGITLNTTSGVLSGTPNDVAKDYQVIVGFKQTNTGLDATPKTLTLKVNSGVKPVITTTSLPVGSVGQIYTGQLTALGNPSGTWTAAPLPPGLDLNATTGAITGTPTGPANTDYQVVVGFTRDGVAADSKTIVLSIDPDPTRPVISTSALPDATRLTPYDFTLAAAGGATGTWSVTPALPAGLSLNAATGKISGTPTTVGTTDLTFGFKSNGVDATPKTLTLTVKQAAAPVITTASLPDAVRQTAYSTKVEAADNPAGTWSATGLPAGLTIAAGTGVISGTPTTVGSSDVEVTFLQNSTNVSTTKTLTLVVKEASGPVIGTASLPDAGQFAAYSVTLTTDPAATGTWSATGLPTGLTLNESTGVISGTPTVAGSFPVELGFKQTSTGLFSTPKTLTLNVVAAPVIATASLPDGLRYRTYSVQLAATGSPAGTWTASPLPVGLTLNPATGVISGQLRNAGDTQVVIGFKQTSTGLLAAPKTLTLHVEQSPPVITTTSLPEGRAFQPYSAQLAVAPAPVGKWTVANPQTLSLQGLTFHTDGSITGSPLGAATITVTATFTETGTGLAATKSFTLRTR